jgi:hypothetical protein
MRPTLFLISALLTLSDSSTFGVTLNGLYVFYCFPFLAHVLSIARIVFKWLVALTLKLNVIYPTEWQSYCFRIMGMVSKSIPVGPLTAVTVRT